MTDLLTVKDVEIHIDEDIKSLHRPHSSEESKEMRGEIDQMGRFPGTITCWFDGFSRTLLDGHHRLDLWCQLPEDTSITPPTVEDISLPDKAAALRWVIRHQLSRRNSTPQELSFIRGRLYNATKPEQGVRSSPGSLPGDHSTVSAEDIAIETGVHERTVRRDGKFADAVETIRSVDPSYAQQLEAGDIKLSKIDIVKLGSLERADIAYCLMNLRCGNYIFEGLSLVDAEECSGTESNGQDAQHEPSLPGSLGLARNSRGEDSAAPDTNADQTRILKSKTIKTTEALLRAFDDLNKTSPNRDHGGSNAAVSDESLWNFTKQCGAIRMTKALLHLARNWC